MPRYFFHIHEHGQAVVHDPEGIELDNEAAAREEAIEGARELMAEKVRTGLQPNGREMVISDEAGTEIVRIPFSSTIKD